MILEGEGGEGEVLSELEVRGEQAVVGERELVEIGDTLSLARCVMSVLHFILCNKFTNCAVPR